MKKEKNRIPPFKPGFHKKVRTRTTMFDLIETLNEVVEKGEEEFVPQIVVHMANRGLLKAVR